MTLSYCINYFFKIMNEKNSLGLNLCFKDHNNPIKLFEEWFNKAKKTEINDPNAFAVGTVNKKGFPTSEWFSLKILIKMVSFFIQI